MNDAAIFFWLAVIATLLAAVIATLAQSLAQAPRAAAEELAASLNRPKALRRVQRIFDDTTGHALSLGLFQVAFSAVSVVATVRYVAILRDGMNPSDLVGFLDVTLGVIIAVIVQWLFVIVIPGAIARHAGARVIFARSLLLRSIDALLWPLRGVWRFFDEVVRRLAGVQAIDAEQQVEADLLSVIEEGQATGALKEEEREMLEAVVRFRDLSVAQIMTPRTDIEAMEATNNLGEITRTVKRLGHSRIPVYDENLDQILGIFYVKDLMHWLGGSGNAGKPFDLKSILRPAFFVPETKTVRELLRELMDKKVHIAMVADEYGGTAGLVTIEDIVEEVFGEIRDEYEPTTPETPDVVLNLPERSAQLDAAARILDVNDALEPLGVQLPASEDYDTVGGFIMTTLGRVPVSGENFEHENMALTILEAKPNRIVRVQLRVRSADDPAPNHAATVAPE